MALTKEILDNYSDILDNDCNFDNWNSEILKRKCEKNYLLQSIKKFLLEQNISDQTYICVSLSGGIDSIVLSYIYYILKHLYPNVFRYTIVCFHIDYANREESKREATFVELWCRHFDMFFHKVIVKEFTRGITTRDIYEEKTREIRYDNYKILMSKYSLKGISVGHHAGDLMENVFTNVMKGRSILDLCVMHLTNIVNGVMLWRPMLHHEK